LLLSDFLFGSALLFMFETKEFAYSKDGKNCGNGRVYPSETESSGHPAQACVREEVPRSRRRAGKRATAVRSEHARVCQEAEEAQEEE
jgi:hypothetical protein